MICVCICICVGATTLFGSFKIYYNIDRIFELYRKVKYKSFSLIYMFIDFYIIYSYYMSMYRRGCYRKYNKILESNIG